MDEPRLRNIDELRFGRLRCPHCGSLHIRRDSASPWIFVAAIFLFPVGLFFLLLNKNVWCLACGTRFKRC
jgi:hypothetical protein